jgi:hypothetical protein
MVQTLKKIVGRRSEYKRKKWWTFGWLLLIVLLLIGYWLLPIQGTILILPEAEQRYVQSWPQLKFETQAPRPGENVILSLSDNRPWREPKLLVNETEARLLENSTNSDGITTWRWGFAQPREASYRAVFYHDCLSGCIERARFDLGAARPTSAPAVSLTPTKLGLVFADEGRDWHGYAGWDVELLYMLQPPASDFGIDTVAQKVQRATRKGSRVLVRLAYDQGQALPPAGDEQALKNYLDYCARIARDERLNEIYGYIIGSGFNRKSENSLAPDKLVTPEWYARVFNGYKLPISRNDNVVQLMRSYNPKVRVLVGAVTPWVNDQNGQIVNSPDAPWLNYMNTLSAYLDESARKKQESGIALASADGFSVQAPGRTDAPDVLASPSKEPLLDLHQPMWGNAQMGFRIYRDWLDIINRYQTSRGLPVYITSTNTFTSDSQIEPAQNYPAGWLTNALAEINSQPQVQALCWFVDRPYDKWSGFSLKAGLGSVKEASLEFDRLLQSNPK